MFCDNPDCGDITKVVKPVELTFPSGEKLKINLCLDCYPERERIKEKIRRNPHKFKAARLLKILKGNPKGSF
jgi:hypothetical protein